MDYKKTRNCLFFSLQNEIEIVLGENSDNFPLGFSKVIDHLKSKDILYLILSKNNEAKYKALVKNHYETELSEYGNLTLYCA